MYSPGSDWALPQPGFPIQKSTDQSLLAAPRGLSQLATSFVGAWCHWHPPCALVRLITIILRPILFISSDKIATGLNNLFSLFSSFTLLCSCQGARQVILPSGDPEDDTGLEADSQSLAPLALSWNFRSFFFLYPFYRIIDLRMKARVSTSPCSLERR